MLFISLLCFYGISRQFAAAPRGGLGTLFQPPAGSKLSEKENY